METKGFTGWIILELFGRQVLAGAASEQMVAGVIFLRLDVPELDGIPAWTKFYGPAAIYSITPTTEDMVMEALRHLRPRPVEPWVVPVRQITKHTFDESED